MPFLKSAYLVGSLLVGAAQVLDAAVLLRSKGVVSPKLMHFSYFEYAWAALSLAALLVRLPPMWLPASFVLYVATLFMLGTAIGSAQTKPSGPIVIPQPLVVLGGVFGAYLAGASAWLLLDS